MQALAVGRVVTLDPKQDFLAESYTEALINIARTPEIKEKMRLVKKAIIQGIPPDAAADLIGRTVAVHESMPFAVYSFVRHTQSFEDTVFCASMNGGDRDTLGAMAGAISGAYLGIEAVPPSWRLRLENQAYIIELATRLVEAM